MAIVKKQLVSVVVPFYNEEDNVEPLMAEIDGVLSGLANYDYECLLVNDGSTDRTGDRIDRLASRQRRVRPVHLETNMGQSAALIAGMRRAQGAFVLTLDGDLQNDPADFPEILSLLAEFDCVCGVRADRQDSWLRKASSRIANTFRHWILQDGISDAGCGTKGFRRECIEHFPAFNGVHRYFAVFVRNSGFSLTECVVNHRPRKHGHSKYGIHNRLWRGLYDLVGVAWLRRRSLVIRVREQNPGTLQPEGSEKGSANLDALTPREDH